MLGAFHISGLTGGFIEQQKVKRLVTLPSGSDGAVSAIEVRILLMLLILLI